MLSLVAASGDRASAQSLVADYERSPGDEPLRNGAVASAHLELGDKDGAFLWLDRAVEDRNPVIFNLKASPQWDPIRSDPRYHQLLKRLNLE